MSEKLSPEDREQRVNDVIVDYLHTLASGQAPNRDEWLARHPELADELRTFFDDDETVRRLAGSLPALEPAAQQQDIPTIPPRDASHETPTVAPACGQSSPLADESHDVATIDSEPKSARDQLGISTGTFGAYELLEKLGEGGMGMVYKARHTKLKRLVALKMIVSGKHARRAELERFRIEAEAVARLQHPGIVQIFEIGEHDGQPYLALEFCEGGTLTDRLRDQPLSPEEAAALVQQMAEAMHAAHRLHVIHRDLKPANVLFAADGQAKITDFGLAKKLDDSEGLTQENAIMGTPSYMAPEQAGGKVATAAADVYALGAILYELLTGRPPFKAATPMDTVLQVISDEPPSPRQLNPKLPPDLETICLKCLEKDPSRRYATAQDLAEELGRFRAGEPILARSITRRERAWRWCKRYPAVAGLAAAVVLVLAGGTGFSTFFAIAAEKKADDARLAQEDTKKALNRATIQEQKATQARNKAQEEEQRALNLAREKSKTVDALRDYLRVADLAAAQAAIDEGDTEQALELLNRYLPKPGEPDRRNFAWFHLLHECRHAQGTMLENGGFCLARSPDGTQVALGGVRSVRLLDTQLNATRKPTTHQSVLRLANPPGYVGQVAFSADGRMLAVACAGGTGTSVGAKVYSLSGIVLYDLTQKKPAPEKLPGQDQRGRAVAISPQGILACAAAGGKIELWNLAERKLLTTLVGHKRVVDGLVFTKDGSRLVSAACGESLRLWDVKTSKLVRVLKDHPNPTPFRDVYFARSFWRCSPVALAVSPDGRYLASGIDGPNILLWNLLLGTPAGELKGHWDAVTGLDFLPDGKTLVSGSLDKDVRLWNVTTRSEIMRLGSHQDIVNAVLVSGDGKEILSSGDDGVTRRWKLPDPDAPPDVIKGSRSLIYSMAFSPDGRQVACGGWDYSIPIYDTETGKLLRRLTGFNGRIHGMAFSADGKYLACANRDEKCLDIWDVNRNTKTRIATTGSVDFVGFSRDGSHIAVASATKSQIFAVKTQKVIGALKGGEPAYSPDGKLLVTRLGKQLLLWDAGNYELVVALSCGEDAVTLPVFSADGNLLACCEDRKAIVIWDMRGRRILHRTQGNTGGVRMLSFCPDGKTLASAGDDARIMLWDLATGKRLATLRGHSARVEALAFSPDGSVLASAGEDTHIRFWRAPLLAKAGQSQTGSDLVARADNFNKLDLNKKKEDVTATTARQAKEAEDAKRAAAEAQLTAEEAKLTAAIGANQRESEHWKARAEHYVKRQQWHAAADDYDQWLQFGQKGPGSMWQVAALAQLHVMVGNEKAYRDYRNIILKRKIVNAGGKAVAARACSLLPRTEEDFQVLLEGAQGAALEDPTSWWHGHSPAPVLYRLGRYQEALEVLRHSEKLIKVQGFEAVHRVWRAMTLHQLKQPDQAKQDLAKAVEIIEKCGAELKTQGVAPLATWAPATQDRGALLEAHILRREAEALILGKDMVEQPVSESPARWILRRGGKVRIGDTEIAWFFELPADPLDIVGVTFGPDSWLRDQDLAELKIVRRTSATATKARPASFNHFSNSLSTKWRGCRIG